MSLFLVILLTGLLPDFNTVMIDDQRITSLISIYPDSRGGYFAACPQGLILAGDKAGSELTQAFARCYRYTGDILWEHGYDLGGFSEFDCAASLTDGYIFGGTHWPTEAPQCGLLIRTDLLGNEMWRKLIPPEEGYQQVYILSVLGRNNGSIVAAGFSVRDNAPRDTDDAIAILMNS